MLLDTHLNQIEYIPPKDAKKTRNVGDVWSLVGYGEVDNMLFCSLWAPLKEIGKLGLWGEDYLWSNPLKLSAPLSAVQLKQTLKWLDSQSCSAVPVSHENQARGVEGADLGRRVIVSLWVIKVGKVIEEDIGPSSCCSSRSSSSSSNSRSCSSSSRRCSSLLLQLSPCRGYRTKGEGCKEIGRGSKMKIFSFLWQKGPRLSWGYAKHIKPGIQPTRQTVNVLCKCTTIELSDHLLLFPIFLLLLPSCFAGGQSRTRPSLLSPVSP